MQERIIQFLKESDGYISGEEMSQRLKMSRAAIWKYMQELRAQGYEIAAVPQDEIHFSERHPVDAVAQGAALSVAGHRLKALLKAAQAIAIQALQTLTQLGKHHSPSM